MYTFLRIFIVVLLVLAVADWVATRRARTIVTNSPSAWSLVSSDIKLRSAIANEKPEGTALLLEETFLPGDIKYESPNGNVRIYFPIVTAILLSLVFTLVLRASRRV
jgi:Protein of unknown function (DUF2905)